MGFATSQRWCSTVGGDACWKARIIALPVAFVVWSAAISRGPVYGESSAEVVTELRYRTTLEESALPWFRLQEGEFPPRNASRLIGGELTGVDHVNRTGTIRPDRTNEQSRAYVDLPLPFAMLPYGSIWFHGAPASLKDIPLGTHLYGEFFHDPVRQENKVLTQQYLDRKLHPYFAFEQVLRIEDDFSRLVRLQELWQIESFSVEEGKLTATRIGKNGVPLDSKPSSFDIGSSTRVWKDRSIVDLTSLERNQKVVVNLTDCTRTGPGRISDIWLDVESRNLATEHQLEIHRWFIKQRGLPGWVNHVDNRAGLVTVTLFDGFDPSLDLNQLFDDRMVTVAVANERLRTYDQVNIVKRGPIVDFKSSIPTTPGSSGYEITFKPSDLLEGFRPTRIVRLFPSNWPVVHLPREEQLRR